MSVCSRTTGPLHLLSNLIFKINNGYELGQIPGDGERQGNLVCIHRVTKSRTWLGYWTTTETLLAPFYIEGIWEQEKLSHLHQVLQSASEMPESEARQFFPTMGSCWSHGTVSLVRNCSYRVVLSVPSLCPTDMQSSVIMWTRLESQFQLWLWPWVSWWPL